MVERTRELADLVDRSIDQRFDTPPPYDFSSVARLLLTRLAGHCRSLAALVEARQHLDARTVTRSAVEHLTLFSWLAIDVAEIDSTRRQDRPWTAQTPDTNARWWISDQMHEDKRRAKFQEREFEGTVDDEMQAAFDSSARLFQAERSWGRLPKQHVMAAEGDARWGGALDGWPNAEPGSPAYTLTLRGFYRILYQAGNTAVHPHLGALVETFVAADGTSAVLLPEVRRDELDPMLTITPYLLLYAMGIADHALGMGSLDDALHILGRWQDVRAPGILLHEIRTLLNDREGRRFGTINGTAISIERAGLVTTFVACEPRGWSRVRHFPGPVWSLDDPEGELFFGPPEMTGPVTGAVALAREHISAAEWLPRGERHPHWPDGAP